MIRSNIIFRADISNTHSACAYAKNLFIYFLSIMLMEISLFLIFCILYIFAFYNVENLINMNHLLSKASLLTNRTRLILFIKVKCDETEICFQVFWVLKKGEEIVIFHHCWCYEDASAISWRDFVLYASFVNFFTTRRKYFFERNWLTFKLTRAFASISPPSAVCWWWK